MFQKVCLQSLPVNLYMYLYKVWHNTNHYNLQNGRLLIHKTVVQSSADKKNLNNILRIFITVEKLFWNLPFYSLLNMWTTQPRLLSVMHGDQSFRYAWARSKMASARSWQPPYIHPHQKIGSISKQLNECSATKETVCRTSVEILMRKNIWKFN